MSLRESSDELNRIFSGAVRYGVYLALLTPLIISGAAAYPFFAKAVVFQILVEIVFAAWLLLAWSDTRYRPDLKQPVTAALAVFAVVLLVSLPFSIDPSRSFWSSRMRMGGAVNILHWLAWFLVLSSFFREWLDWRNFFRFSTFVCLAVDALAFLMPWSAGRAVSTLDNSNFLAAYLLLHVFIALILARLAAAGRGRIFYWAVAAAHSLVIFLAGSRGVLLALVVAGLAAAFHYALRGRGRKTGAAVLALAVGVLLAATLGVYWLRTSGSAWGQQHLPTYLTHGVYDNFGGDRLSMWRLALVGFGERPWFGWGMENFQVVVDGYFDPVGADRFMRSDWYDRAHNRFFEDLYSVGSIGFAADLLVWAVLFVVLLRLSRRASDPRDREIAVLAVLAFAAYLFQDMFSLETPMVSMVLFGLLAFAVFLSRPASAPPTRAASKRKASAEAPLRTSRLSALVAVPLVMAAVVYHVNIRPAWNSILNTQAYPFIGMPDDQALGLFRASLASPSYVNHDLRVLMIDGLKYVAEQYSSPPPGMADSFRFAAAEMDQAVVEHPHDTKALWHAAIAHRLLAAVDPAEAPKAEAAAAAAINAAPRLHLMYEEAAEVALGRQDWAAALRWQRTALSLTTEPSTLGRINFRMVRAAIGLGDVQEALELLKTAETLRFGVFRDVRLVRPLAEAAWPAGTEEQIVVYIDGVSANFPAHPDVLWAYALAHAKAGDMDVARKALEELRKRNPEMAGELDGRW